MGRDAGFKLFGVDYNDAKQKILPTLPAPEQAWKLFNEAVANATSKKDLAALPKETLSNYLSVKNVKFNKRENKPALIKMIIKRSSKDRRHKEKTAIKGTGKKKKKNKEKKKKKKKEKKKNKKRKRSEAEDEEAEQYLETGHEWIGSELGREFDDNVVIGVVISWIPENKDTGDEALWHVRHADGDEEDLELAEVEEGFLLLESHRSKQDAPKSIVLQQDNTRGEDAVEVTPTDNHAVDATEPELQNSESSSKEVLLADGIGAVEGGEIDKVDAAAGGDKQSDVSPTTRPAAKARITIWNKTQRRKMTGNAAPLETKISEYLRKHPDCEVYDGQDKAVVEEDSSQILGTEAISGAQRDKDGDLIFTVFDQSVQTPAYVSLPHR